MTNDADYYTRPESCRKAADKSRPTLLPFSWPQYQQPLEQSVPGHFFNCLTGGACASPVEKIAPPVFLTCPPKILLHVRRFIISFL